MLLRRRQINSERRSVHEAAEKVKGKSRFVPKGTSSFSWAPKNSDPNLPGGVNPFENEDDQHDQEAKWAREYIDEFEEKMRNGFEPGEYDRRKFKEMKKIAGKHFAKQHMDVLQKSYRDCFQQWILGKHRLLNSKKVTPWSYSTLAERFPRAVNFALQKLEHSEKVQNYLFGLWTRGPQSELEVEKYFKYLVYPVQEAFREWQLINNDADLKLEDFHAGEKGELTLEGENYVSLNRKLLWPPHLVFQGCGRREGSELPMPLDPTVNKYMRPSIMNSLSYEAYIRNDYSKLNPDIQELWEVANDRGEQRRDREIDPWRHTQGADLTYDNELRQALYGDSYFNDANQYGEKDKLNIKELRDRGILKTKPLDSAEGRNLCRPIKPKSDGGGVVRGVNFRATGDDRPKINVEPEEDKDDSNKPAPSEKVVAQSSSSVEQPGAMDKVVTSIETLTAMLGRMFAGGGKKEEDLPVVSADKDMESEVIDNRNKEDPDSVEKTAAAVLEKEANKEKEREALEKDIQAKVNNNAPDVYDAATSETVTDSEPPPAPKLYPDLSKEVKKEVKKEKSSLYPDLNSSSSEEKKSPSEEVKPSAPPQSVDEGTLSDDDESDTEGEFESDNEEEEEEKAVVKKGRSIFFGLIPMKDPDAESSSDPNLLNQQSVVDEAASAVKDLVTDKGEIEKAIEKELEAVKEDMGEKKFAALSSEAIDAFVNQRRQYYNSLGKGGKLKSVFFQAGQTLYSASTNFLLGQKQAATVESMGEIGTNTMRTLVASSQVAATFAESKAKLIAGAAGSTVKAIGGAIENELQTALVRSQARNQVERARIAGDAALATQDIQHQTLLQLRAQQDAFDQLANHGHAEPIADGGVPEAEAVVQIKKTRKNADQLAIEEGQRFLNR